MGDGKETCGNPAHGFISVMAGIGNGDINRLGCPCCGHDPSYKVKGGGVCYTCNGSGLVNSVQEDLFYQENPHREP